MGKRILVTGGCGFIGANLVPILLERGYQVRVLDNLSRGQIDFLPKSGFEFLKGDIRDSEAVADACKDIDKVVHLAAYGSVIESVEYPDINFEVNAWGTLKLLEAARDAGVSRFVFASTGGALIGDAEPPVSEDSNPRPKSPYGASKLVGEGYCHAFAGSYDLPTVMLRFGNVYGPVSAHKKGAVTAFIKAIMRGEDIVIYGDGTASRDLLHVSDLCDGIVRALETDLEPGSVFHLATGRETSVAELAELLKSVADVAEHPVVFRAARRGEVLRNFANYDKARETLGFSPEISLEEGLARTWEWFKDEKNDVFSVATSDS